MTEYQNWNDSRWDYMKSQSKWQDKNIVTIAVEDLTPSGMKDKLSKTRQTFLPLLNEIITNEIEQ
jgi:hypothetical protein